MYASRVPFVNIPGTSLSLCCLSIPSFYCFFLRILLIHTSRHTMHARRHTHARVTHTHTHTHTRAHTHTHTHTHTRTYPPTPTPTPHTHTHLRASPNAHTHTRTHARTLTNTNTNVATYVKDNCLQPLIHPLSGKPACSKTRLKKKNQPNKQKQKPTG